MSTSTRAPLALGGLLAAVAVVVCSASDAGAQPAPAPAAPPPAPGDDAAAAPAAPAPPTTADATPAPDGATAPVEGAATAPDAAEAEGPAPDAGATATASDDDVVVVTEGGIFESGLSGEGEAPGTPAGPGGGAFGLELNGHVRGDLFVGKVRHRDRAELKAAYGEVGLQLRARGGEHGAAFAELRLREGQQLDERRLFTELREAYVNAYVGRLDLRLGHQIVQWGRASGLNPTNNVTPIDLRIRSPYEDDRRLANAGARAFLDLRPVRLEGIWMPLYRATELPPVESPWFVTMGRTEFPAPALENGLFAGKVHLELPAFEASASFLHGYAPMPGLVRAGFGDVGATPEVFIARRAYQHDVVGLDFSTTIRDFIAVRGEAAYRRPVDRETGYHVPSPDLQYVLGVDRDLGPVSVILQYGGRYVLDWEEHPPADANFDLIQPDMQLDQELMDLMGPLVDEELANRNQILAQQTAELQHLLSARLEWLTLHETLSLSVMGMVDVTTEEWLAYPKVSYRISDQMTTSVGGEIYSGPDGTLLGLIDETLTGGYAELRVSF